MIFSSADWKNFNSGTQKEWLLTNGIGGYASSSIIGANTRRYHGLLVASLNPPVKRHLIISKFDEVLEVNDQRYELGTNHTPDYTSNGYKYLKAVEVDKTVIFNYNIQDIFIEKKITMVYGKNTVAVVYKIINGIDKAVFKVYPLVNFRNHHGDSRRENINLSSKLLKDGVLIRPQIGGLDIQIRASKGKFHTEDMWFYNMDYIVEKERGLQSTEDHYMPGYFEIEIEPNEEKVITIVGSIDNIDTLDGFKIISNQEQRIESLIKKAGYNDEFINALVMEADKFIVYRKSTNAKTIIAGYPWFTDWGRDTMIALPGLTLVTKRFDDAKDIFLSFVKYINNGLVPNMFPDEGQEPIYNTVDASLWFFEAVFKFVKYTNEYSFVKDNLFSKMKEIIECYKKGTDFNIKMDEDGLICSGNENTQLTWMDAKIGDIVVTPRHGKAVEINALWYNALKIMSILSRKFDQDYEPYEKLAHKVEKSFNQFWNQEQECLYDVIINQFKDDKVRPNQIIAVSLSYPVISGEKAEKVVNKVFKELYASMGLKSLSSKHNEYVGIYIGDQYRRDFGYHQGTVWGWLWGPFITAYARTNQSHNLKDIYNKLVLPIKEHLKDAGVGSISEIFDGDNPHYPRGCFAQAWSVAEVLRAYVENIKNFKA